MLAEVEVKPKFKIGDRVRAISASYGWGIINENDEGTIAKSVNKNEWGVNFPAYNDWFAKDSDLELISPSAPSKEKPAPTVTVEVLKWAFADCVEWITYAKFKYSDYYARLTIAPMITGCGIGQILGVADFCNSTQGTEALGHILEYAAHYYNDNPEREKFGCGALVATLGKSFRKNGNEKRLISLGFKKVKSYENWRHKMNGSEKQAMYVYNLPRLKK